MKVEQVVPILNVSDVEASFAWFAKLGWSKQFEWDAEDPAAPPTLGDRLTRFPASRPGGFALRRHI
jgi:hypothetical protein